MSRRVTFIYMYNLRNSQLSMARPFIIRHNPYAFHSISLDPFPPSSRSLRWLIACVPTLTTTFCTFFQFVSPRHNCFTFDSVHLSYVVRCVFVCDSSIYLCVHMRFDYIVTGCSIGICFLRFVSFSFSGFCALYSGCCWPYLFDREILLRIIELLRGVVPLNPIGEYVATMINHAFARAIFIFPVWMMGSQVGASIAYALNWRRRVLLM